MSHDLNQAVLKALGLDKERNLTSVKLELAVDQLPRLTLKRAIIDADGLGILHKVEWRELVDAEVEPPAPFDLQDACHAALLKVRDLIDRRANFERDKVRRDFGDLAGGMAARFDNLIYQHNTWGII